MREEVAAVAPFELAAWPTPLAGCSLAAALTRLRHHGVPAPAAVRIPANSTDAQAAEAIASLVATLNPHERCEALLVQSDHIGCWDDGSADADGENDDESFGTDAFDDGHGCVQLASADWLQQALRCVAACDRSAAVCVQHDPANGRIGLLLRRCPPLWARVELDGAAVHDHTAADTPLDAMPLAPVAPPTAPPAAAQEAAARLLWGLRKVYCAGDLAGGGARFGAFSRDADDWRKVEWRLHDDAALVGSVAQRAACALAPMCGDASAIHLALALCFGRRAAEEEAAAPRGDAAGAALADRERRSSDEDGDERLASTSDLVHVIVQCVAIESSASRHLLL